MAAAAMTTTTTTRAIGYECQPGDSIWVPSANKDSATLFQQGRVLAVDEATATVRTPDRVLQIDLLTTMPMIVNQEEAAADMTSLHHIHEAGILSNIKNRSLRNEPYSFMSSVLIAVNPLRATPEPFPAGGEVSMMLPHPYVVAEVAFQQMVFKNALVRNQSIVIAGESGAGKTESAKLVLAHLVAKTAQSSSSTADHATSLDKRLLGTSPILESFGNSVTLRNPNSSRFGKMMRLHFSSSSSELLGATVQSYLLERSRVTSHEPGERAFHVVYQLLACQDHALLQELHLVNDWEFRYAKPGKLAPEQDLEGYQTLVQSLRDIGIAEPQIVFQVLAGILHLGEIQFVDVTSNTEGNTAVVSTINQSLQIASELLGLDATECSKVFCERKLLVMGKLVISKRSARAAGFARDAAAKAIYSSLFDWLVRQINANVGGGTQAASMATTTTTLGVLDIFGFESFKVNQFEQLLINYCNEALQGTFNAQIFVAEASLYEKEGLFGADELTNRPIDNGICVELLQSKTGLLSIIDSEGRSPDCSDAKMLQRIHTVFGNHAVMIKPHPKDAARTFIIRHYCAQVVYTVGSFLEKNNDRLPDDLEQFLAASSKPLVRDLFPQLLASASSTTPGKAPPPARSICAKFTSQIRTLVEDLENTKCSFIRCVKPNSNMLRVDGDNTWFDERYVQLQLHALNVPQTCEVLRNGFPTRLDYSVLVDLYWKILPQSVLERYTKTNGGTGGNAHKSFCQALFFAFKISPDSYKLGRTKVFFKSGQLAQLESVLKSGSSTENGGSGGGLSEEVMLRFRLCFIRIKWRRILVASLALKQFEIMFQNARAQTVAATRIQAFVRARLARKSHLRLLRGAREAQRFWRGRKAREVARELRLEKLLEAKRIAELAEQSKREREEAARKALLLEIQGEKMRKEALEQARLVEEALAKQAEETRLQQERDQMKRRQSVKIARKSIIAAKVANRGDASVLAAPNASATAAAEGGVEMRKKSSLRSKTLIRKSDLEQDFQRKRQSIRQTAMEDEEGSGGGGRGEGDSEDNLAAAAKRRVQRRNKSLGSVTFATSTNLAPKKMAKPSNLLSSGGARTGAEQKSSVEKMATMAREHFSIKVKGVVLVLDTKTLTETLEVTTYQVDDDAPASSSGGGIMSMLKNKLLRPRSGSRPQSLSPAKAGGEEDSARVTITTKSSISKRWIKFNYVLDKPSRELCFYSMKKNELYAKVDLTATLKVREVAVAKQNHAVELKSPSMQAIYVAFETAEEKRVWERDVREAVIGYRAPVHLAADRGTAYSMVGDDDERMMDLYALYSDQLRQERLAQIVKLYKQGEITKEEFDKTCEVISRTPDPGSRNRHRGRGGGDSDDDDDDDENDFESDRGSQEQCPKCQWNNNTLFGRFNCLKCGHALATDGGAGTAGSSSAGTSQAVVLKKLKSPFAMDMPYEDGRVSAELVGRERSMNFNTYQEVFLFGIDLRFRDEELLELEIGWLISHSMDKFVQLHDALVDPNGPLTPAARKRVPKFPADLKEDSFNAAEVLGAWLGDLFRLVPQGGKQTDFIYHEEEEDEEEGEEGAAGAKAAEDEQRFTAEWRSVKDVETGDLYYFNKKTGETTWVNPFNVRAMRDLKTKLPINWEAVVDKETGDVYYWNKVTQETTWEKPKFPPNANSKKRKQFEANDLLHVQVVNKFFDLKRNAKRMDDLANQ